MYTAVEILSRETYKKFNDLISPTKYQLLYKYLKFKNIYNYFIY